MGRVLFKLTSSIFLFIYRKEKKKNEIEKNSLIQLRNIACIYCFKSHIFYKYIFKLRPHFEIYRKTEREIDRKKKYLEIDCQIDRCIKKAKQQTSQRRQQKSKTIKQRKDKQTNKLITKTKPTNKKINNTLHQMLDYSRKVTLDSSINK